MAFYIISDITCCKKATKKQNKKQNLWQIIICQKTFKEKENETKS